MAQLLLLLVCFVVGFISGALFGRRNKNKVDKAVDAYKDMRS